MSGRAGSAGRVPGGTTAQALFLLVLLVYLLVLGGGLRELSQDARFFPGIILSIAAVFLALKAISVASAGARRYLEPGLDVPAAPTPTVPPGDAAAPRAARKALVAWLWVGAAVVSMYLLGFLAGTALSVLAYLRLVARDGWRASLIAAGATLAFAYLVFTRAMHIELEFGVLGRVL
jgi:hypothetical protein